MEKEIVEIVESALSYPVGKGFDLFGIDLTMLDKEWMEHSKIFLHFSLKVTKSTRKVAEAKAKLDLVRGELARKIRFDPDKYGLDKATEAAISNIIPTRKKYKKYLRLLNDAIENHNCLQDIVTALDHRRRGLERLVQLHGSSYFSEPRALDERSKIVADRIAKKSARMANRRKEKKRQAQ